MMRSTSPHLGAILLLLVVCLLFQASSAEEFLVTPITKTDVVSVDVATLSPPLRDDERRMAYFSIDFHNSLKYDRFRLKLSPCTGQISVYGKYCDPTSQLADMRCTTDLNRWLPTRKSNNYSYTSGLKDSTAAQGGMVIYDCAVSHTGCSTELIHYIGIVSEMAPTSSSPPGPGAQVNLQLELFNSDDTDKPFVPADSYDLNLKSVAPFKVNLEWDSMAYCVEKTNFRCKNTKVIPNAKFSVYYTSAENPAKNMNTLCGVMKHGKLLREVDAREAESREIAMPDLGDGKWFITLVGHDPAHPEHDQYFVYNAVTTTRNGNPEQVLQTFLTVLCICFALCCVGICGCIALCVVGVCCIAKKSATATQSPTAYANLEAYPYSGPNPTGPYLAPNPTGPYAGPNPTNPYSGPNPTGPYSAPNPTGPYARPNPTNY